MKVVLESYRYLLDEIDSLILQRKEIETKASKITAALGETPGTGGADQRKIERYAIKLAAIDNRIEKKIDNLEKVCEGVQAMIHTLPPGNERSVLEFKYINGMSGEEIAGKTFYSVNYVYQLISSGTRKITEIYGKTSNTN